MRNYTAIGLWAGCLTVWSALTVGGIVFLVEMGLPLWWSLPMILLGRYFLGLYNAVNRSCDRLLDSERVGGHKDYGFSGLD